MSEAKYEVATTGPKIDAFLRKIFDIAGFRLTYEIVPGDSTNPEIENPELMVKFSGADIDLLLSNRAELLLALEHVTMEALHMPNEDHSRLSFDANDYRLLRIEELRLSATVAADKVTDSGTPFRFNPMNSRERRVVHLTLRNRAELRSESAGAGAFRHVVIYPAGMASLPEPPMPERRLFGGSSSRPSGGRPSSRPGGSSDARRGDRRGGRPPGRDRRP